MTEHRNDPRKLILALAFCLVLCVAGALVLNALG